MNHFDRMYPCTKHAFTALHMQDLNSKSL